MAIHYRTKRNLLQILPFGIVSFAFALVYMLIEKGILGDYPEYPSTGNPYKFNWLIPSIAAGLFGLVIGYLELRFLNKWFQKGSFTKKIVFKSFSYMCLIAILAIGTTTIGTAYELGKSPFSDEVLVFVFQFLSSFAFWTILIYITLGIVICLFYLEVSNNIGQNVLLNLFAGKYHKPTQERRIFMFVDMKSSTTIAEKLGHVTYFELLKEYYDCLSDPIIDHGGEIYQYVGDEVVITWKLKEQSTPDCIECFFAMQDSLRAQAQKHKATYGVAPSFKAGIHLGKVSTGEIGSIKKNIVFTGDVLNTTARIQGKCNAFQVSLLCSKELIQALGLEKSYTVIELGKTELRGKNEEVVLYTLEKTKS